MISSSYNKSSNEKLEIENAYGARKSGNVTEYNFDINKMIKDFSFYDFIDQTRGGKKDNGAFLVVTDKQYILGYNADYGLGSHQQSFARCEAEIFFNTLIPSRFGMIMSSNTKSGFSSIII